MHHDLILNLLKTTSQNKNIYPLLEQHLGRLDRNFALSLRKIASNEFNKDPANAINIARVIVKFSNYIQKFEQGNFASNLEIAIAGYESALTVITRETFPQGWASIQQTLVSVYQQRQDILSATITELKENTVKTQTQINDLTEQFQQEKQQSYELKAQVMKVIESQNYSAPAIDLQPIVSAIQETKLPVQQFNTVIFYDIENLTQGNNNRTFDFSLEDIRERIKRYSLVNKIAGQYAYADWSDRELRRIKPEVQKLGIEPIQIFGFNFHSNAADIQLVIDAVELIHSKPSLQVFVIVSGDGGFSCLAKKLHEYGKVVIGCGYENHTNKVLAEVCDYFIRLPEPVRQHRNRASNSTNRVEPPQLRKNS
ncbi:MAG: NYN domain-containing protein [Cyanobacteria bacterium J06635_10]